jgi:hypothetical protein
MISRKSFSIISAYFIFTLMISACAGSTSTVSIGNIQSVSESTSSELVAFDGKVFVATTKPDHQHWLSAGWQISSQVVTGDEDSVLTDCTLYPHQGVDDQWIGSCSGSTLIPREGARHIAVIHTASDGTTRMVQVAPLPVANSP